MRNSVILLALIAFVPASGAQTPYGASGTAQLPEPPPLVLSPKPKPPKLEHLPKVHAQGLLGEPVLDAKGAAIGHVVNVLIDQAGAPKAAVIEFAGFFGVGDRNIAVAWDALHFAVIKGRISISITLNAEKLKAMPVYQPDAKSVPVATQAPAKAAP